MNRRTWRRAVAAERECATLRERIATLEQQLGAGASSVALRPPFVFTPALPEAARWLRLAVTHQSVHVALPVAVPLRILLDGASATWTPWVTACEVTIEINAAVARQLVEAAREG